MIKDGVTQAWALREMGITQRQCPHAYAQRRANETGRAYIVTGMGHAWIDCARNRQNLADYGGLAARYRKVQP